MKISDFSQGSNKIQYVNQSNSPEKQPPAQEVKNQEAFVDKVELSAQSKEIKKINDVLEMTPDVRAERIAELKKLVQEGQYQVDSEKIAEKMLAESIFDFTK